MLNTNAPLVRFGVFEVDLQSGELRKSGRRIALQEQPFRVLVRLLEHPGQLVTREELRAELWPADTFVDFEQGLNAAMRRLRETLGDSADSPRYIETLARRGYRFLPPLVPDQPGPSAPPRYGVNAALILAIVGLAALVGSIVFWLLREPAPARVVRTDLSVRPAQELNAGGIAPIFLPTRGGSRTALAWTPDGQQLVFVGRRNGVQQLYVRALDAVEARPLQGTDDAQVPAVSPDGEWVAFWAAGAIKKVRFASGPVIDVATGISIPPFGLTWDGRGNLYFGRDDLRIWKASADGTLSPVTTLGPTEMAHILPFVLSDGKSLLYTVRKGFSWRGTDEVVVQSLTTGTRKMILRDAVDAREVRSGHLVFLRRGVLFAVAFDVEHLEARGTPTPMVDAVSQALTAAFSTDVTGAGQIAIATTGTLAWVPGSVTNYPDGRLVVVDRHGRVSPINGPVTSYVPIVRVAPDGRQLAVNVQAVDQFSVWIYDMVRGTFAPVVGVRDADATYPTWTPDGQRLLFNWYKDGRPSIAWQPADATALPELLATGDLTPSSWTPDGRQLALTTGDSGDLAIATFKDGRCSVQRMTPTPYREQWPEFSPDGHWLAFGSDESGRNEVYLQRWPGPGKRIQMSLDGGESPAWHPNGQELFFLSLPDRLGRRRMMAARFQPGSPPRIGAPQTLFEFTQEQVYLRCIPVRCYDVAADGRHFYAVQMLSVPPPPAVTYVSLVQNWTEELKAKVPVK